MRNKEAQVYFWTSVRQGTLEKLANSIHEQGVSAQHLAYMSAERYRKARRKWERFRMRVGLYIGYPLLLIWKILWSTPRGSCLVVTSNTFYAPLTAWFFGRIKKIRVIHLLFDIYPDALVESGKLSARSWTARGIAFVTRRTLRHCNGNVFIGKRMRGYAEQQYGQARQGKVILLPAEGVSRETRGTEIQESTSGRLTLLYCGNLGYLHDVETLPRALERVDTQVRASLHIRFQVSGGRVRESHAFFKNLAQKYPELAITLGGSLGDEEWKQAMQEADIGISTMLHGAEKVLFPSKTFTAMASGQAILAICPQNSDLADLVVDSGSGWSVKPGAYQELAHILEEIVSDQKGLRQCQAHALQYAETHFPYSVVAKEWIEYLQS